MKIFAIEEASEFLNGESLDESVARLRHQLPLVNGAYKTPVDSGKQTWLAKSFAYLLFRDSDVCLYITTWNVWLNREHLDLFYGYRRASGERRLLIEAPVHLFQRIDAIEAPEPTEDDEPDDPWGATDEDELISILCMVFYFFWDAWVFDLAGGSLLKLSHDGWFEVRARDEALINAIAEALKDVELLHSRSEPK